MILRDSHIVAAGMIGLTALIGATLYFRWDADGPGTHGGGEDLNRKEAAPMAAPGEQPELPDEQRRRERATISGRVSDSEGAPIAGATVCAMASSALLSESDTRWPRCADTGADGRYVIADLYGVQHRVSASAAGHLPADHTYTRGGARRRSVELRPGAAAQDIDVELVRGGVEIGGVVMDLQGRPIADARVAGGGADSNRAFVWGRTGADGRWALWVRPGTVTVSAHAPGTASASVTGPSEGQTFPLYLGPTSTLRGKVLAGDGTPIAGAWVRASATGGATQTDAAGHFTLDALAPGVYTPWAETDDWFGMAAEQVKLGLGETSRLLVITGRPAVFVEGQILHGGAPCEDGTLSLREGVSGREIHDNSAIDGMVHVRGLLPGTYAVAVTCRGAIEEDRHPPLIVADRDLLARTWDVTDGRTIAGVVVDASGEPVAGVTLAARPIAGSATLSAAVSDAEGRFLLRGLVAGPMHVVPIRHGRRTMPDAPVAVTIGSSDVADLRVALAATGEVRGTLLGPQRRPIVGAELSLRTARGDQRTRSGDDGGFHFTRAAVGRSAIAASLGGVSLPLLAQPQLQVRVGVTTSVALVSTASMGEIRGVILDATGQPLVGALVEAQAEDAAPTAGAGPPQLTDGAGRFTLAGLAGEAYTITAYPLGGGEVRREHVKRGAAQVLTLAPGARVRGSVLAPGGGAPDSFTIEVIDGRAGSRRAETFIATGGAWGFDGLAAGSHEVRVRAREGTGARTLKLAAGETQDELRISLVGAATMRGRVVDLAGTPVPGLEVGLSSAKGVVWDMRALTDAAGRFELTRVSTGPVFVTVGPPGGRTSRFGASRVAIDVPIDQAIVDLPAIRVARRRIAVDQARGDLGFTIEASAAGDDPLLADLRVAAVRHEGPAATAGLRAHDEIVSVDEQDVRGPNRSLYSTLTVVPAGTTVRLGLARGVTLAITASAQR
jgi:protocatechuate 3,4-dioxygenase beta subunit